MVSNERPEKEKCDDGGKDDLLNKQTIVSFKKH